MGAEVDICKGVPPLKYLLDFTLDIYYSTRRRRRERLRRLLHRRVLRLWRGQHDDKEGRRAEGLQQRPITAEGSAVWGHQDEQNKDEE